MRPVAQVAQLVEQGIENPRVGGSIPSLGTMILKARSLLGLFFACMFVPPRITAPKRLQHDSLPFAQLLVLGLLFDNLRLNSCKAYTDL